MHTLQQHLDSATIMANVQALLPEIEQRRSEVAAARRLPPDLVASLKTAGAFRIAMPHEWGGPEMSMPDQLRLFELLAHADPAVSWCVMIGCDAGYFSAFLDDAAGRTLWPDLDMVTAGWLTPAGHARRVDDGYLVDGRWSFGSGCTHADVLLGGCLVFNRTGELETDAAGLPTTRLILAPANRFEVLDTWHTTGLAGSGSNDFTCQHLFVPDEHTFALSDPIRRPGPLYQFPGAFTTKFHGTVLGLARRAIDEVITIADSKVLMPQMVPMREVPRVQTALADAEAALRAPAPTATQQWKRCGRRSSTSVPSAATNASICSCRGPCRPHGAGRHPPDGGARRQPSHLCDERARPTRARRHHTRPAHRGRTRDDRNRRRTAVRHPPERPPRRHPLSLDRGDLAGR